MFTHQSPQKLKVIREHALIESAISSNRIEGVEVDKSRIGTLIFGEAPVHDRDEEEVRGYRDALKLVHEQAAKLAISESTIKTLHKLSRGQIWDAGVYKEKDADIIEKFADGRSRIRFPTVSAKETPEAMAEMIELWQRGLEIFILDSIESDIKDSGLQFAYLGRPRFVQALRFQRSPQNYRSRLAVSALHIES